MDALAVEEDFEDILVVPCAFPCSCKWEIACNHYAVAGQFCLPADGKKTGQLTMDLSDNNSVSRAHSIGTLVTEEISTYYSTYSLQSTR